MFSRMKSLPCLTHCSSERHGGQGVVLRGKGQDSASTTYFVIMLSHFSSSVLGPMDFVRTPSMCSTSAAFSGKQDESQQWHPVLDQCFGFREFSQPCLALFCILLYDHQNIFSLGYVEGGKPCKG